MEENLPNIPPSATGPSPRRIWIKRILLGILGIFVSLLVTAVVVVTVYEDEIVRYALDSFQKNIKTKSEVKEADLTLWENFPMVSIRLKNVYVEEDSKRKDTLLYANELLFSFDIIDVFSGKYNIDEVGLKGAKCDLRIDKKGRENWNVLVEDTSTTDKKFNVKIEKIFANDADVVVENEAEKSFYHLGFKQLEAAGKFSEEMFMLDLETKGTIHNIFAGSTDLLSNKRFEIDSKLDVNLKEEHLHLAKTELTIQEVPLVLEGTIHFGNNPSIDLDVEKTELDLEQGIRLLPAQFQVQLKPYEPSGKATFNFSMHGKFDQLRIASDFTVNDGALKEINSGVELSNIGFSAAYRLENSKDSIQVQSCSATLGSGQLQGSGTIRNLANPHLNLNVQLQSNLEELKGFLGWDSLATAAGDVNLQAAIYGQIAFSEVDSTFDWSQINVNGSAAFANASIQVTGSDVKLNEVNGTFWLNGSDARVENLSFSFNDNKVLLSGDLLQFIPYLTTDYRTLEIRANFYSHKLDLNTLLKEGGGQEEIPLVFPNRMNIRVNAQIDEFLYKNFKASQIQGVIYCANKALAVDPLNMQVAGGTVSANFNLYPNASKRYTMTSTATLKHIQVENVFVLFDDFGQTYLTRNNIKGSTDAQLYYYSELSEKFEVMPETIEAEADVRIENGELNDVESLQYLTEYLKGNKWIAPFVKEDVFAEKLRHVKFSTLENTISIKNSVITFPLMDIESSAMDISIEGSHTFSNYLDYRIGFDLKDILLSQNSEKNGRQLFLYMKGPIDNLEFGLDKEALRSDRVSAREKQRSKIRQLFNGEISLRNNDGTGGLKQLFTKPPTQASDPGTPVNANPVQPEKTTKPPREKKTPTWLQEKNEYEVEE